MRHKAAVGFLSIGLISSLFGIVAACSSTPAEEPTNADAATTDGAPSGNDGGPNPDSATCVCAPPNATGGCEAGACAITACDPHRLDCDNNVTNGCELDDNTSASKCGGCNQICEDCAIGSVDKLVKKTIVTAPINPACDRGVCCPGGDAGACVSISLDFTLVGSDLPRLTTAKPAGESRADIRARFRIKTAAGAGIPVTVPNVGECLLSIDTAPGAFADLRVDMTWSTLLVPDAGGQVQTTGGQLTLSQLELEDVKLTGAAGCTTATPGLGYFGDILTPILEPIFRKSVCDACPCQTL